MPDINDIWDDYEDLSFFTTLANSTKSVSTKERAELLANRLAKEVDKKVHRFSREECSGKVGGWYVELENYSAEFRDNGEFGLAVLDPDNDFEFCPWADIEQYSTLMRKILCENE